MAKFNTGDKVIKNGFAGIVIREYLPNMYEVKLASGTIVVPSEELRAV